MAFESLHGMKVGNNTAEQSFVVGDYFAVYTRGIELPRIYQWNEVTAIAENRLEFLITADGTQYTLPKTMIADVRRQLALRAILEGIVAAHPLIDYKYQKRVLPPKTLYHNCDTPPAAYVARGTYNYQELSYSNVVLLGSRIGKALIAICILTSIIVFILLDVFLGQTGRNWFYFLPIAVMSGGVVTMFAYLVCSMLAKYLYASLLHVDPAVTQSITFVVSNEGFAAVESDLYTGSDLISWDDAMFFIETNYVFMVYHNQKAIFWLPKRFFPKDVQKDISNFIAQKIAQK